MIKTDASSTDTLHLLFSFRRHATQVSNIHCFSHQVRIGLPIIETAVPSGIISYSDKLTEFHGNVRWLQTSISFMIYGGNCRVLLIGRLRSRLFRTYRPMYL